MTRYNSFHVQNLVSQWEKWGWVKLVCSFTSFIIENCRITMFSYANQEINQWDNREDKISYLGPGCVSFCHLESFKRFQMIPGFLLFLLCFWVHIFLAQTRGQIFEGSALISALWINEVISSWIQSSWENYQRFQVWRLRSLHFKIQNPRLENNRKWNLNMNAHQYKHVHNLLHYGTKIHC